MSDLLDKLTKEETGLHKHKGCRDCTRNCIFNAPVANKETAERSSKIKFNCNSSIYNQN